MPVSRRKIPVLLLTLLSAAFATTALRAQTTDSVDTPTATTPVLRFSGAADVYYAYDFSEPLNQDRLYTTQAFRHNEFNLNYGYLQAQYEAERVRATFALHTGTYVQVNYAAEPNDLTRLIGQANAGFRLTKKTWLDAGILPSHIGYESTFSGNNEIYTRALMAENSPYYETGAQLTHEATEKLTLKLLVLNGWQNIHETNSAKSLGMGIGYAATEKLSLSYNNYYGNEAPDGSRASRRFFHNFYGKYIFTERFHAGGSFDFGSQQTDGTGKYRHWFTGMALARYELNSRFALAGRVEHYNDRHQLIVATDTPRGFQTSSASLNFDYSPSPGFLLRLEGRGYTSRDRIFTGEDGAARSNLLLVCGFSAKI